MNIKKITTGIIALSFCVLLAVVSDAQTWRSLTTADGLVDNRITLMLEDQHGNLWFGTEGGLSQFNGFFTTHLSGMSIYSRLHTERVIGNGILESKTSIPCSTLLESTNGTIWAGTRYMGLRSYDGTTWQKHLSGNTILCLLESKNGTIWAGASTEDSYGLYRYNGTTIWQKHLDQGVISLLESKDGKIWAGAYSTPDWIPFAERRSGGLHCYDGKIWQEQERLNGKTVLFLFESTDGTIWAGTSDWSLMPGDLYSYDGKTWRKHLSGVTCLLESSDSSIWAGTTGGLQRYDGTTWQEYLNGRYISSLLASQDGTVWVGTNSGFYSYDGITWHEYLSGENISHLLESEDGTIFVGTYYNGVYIYNRKTWREQLKEMEVISLLKSTDGKIWAGTHYDSLYSYDGKTWQEQLSAALYPDIPRETPFSPSSTPRLDYVLLESKDGTIWVGCIGLHSYDGTTWQKHLNGWVISLLESSDGTIWAGTTLGLYSSYDGTTWEEQLPDLKSVTPFLETSDGNILAGAWMHGLYSYDGTTWRQEHWQAQLNGIPVTSLLESSDATIWAGTYYNGLHSYSFDRRAWREHAPLIGTRIICLLESSDGTIWAGGHNGLYSFNGITWQRHLNGMWVTSLLESKDGRVWVGTEANGVQIYDGMIWQELTVLDGLPNDTIWAILENDDGSLWFGTGEGIGVYKPSDIPPVIEITDPRKQTVKIGLPFISIDWRAGDLETPTNRLTYQYKIDANAWSKRILDNSVKNLLMSDGEHTFYVRAIDSDFNYSKTAALTIIVDTIRPNVLIGSPAYGAIVAGTVKIIGGVTDNDLKEFRVEYAVGDEPSDDAFKLISKSEQEVVLDVLAEWDTKSLPEQLYTIRLSATDNLEHKKDYSITVTVDNTLPTVKIISPTENESLSGTISIKGQISDDNLKSYELMWTQAAVIDSKTIWRLIVHQELEDVSDAKIEPEWNSTLVSGKIGFAYPPEKVYSREYLFLKIEPEWDTTQVSGLTTIRLLARDKAGNTNTSDVQIDLTNPGKPLAFVRSPVPGAVIAGFYTITGTVDDPTFISYTVDFGAGEQPKTWTEIIKKSSAVIEDTLAKWDTTDLNDGTYTLRLTATDSNGYLSVVTLLAIVDNTEPKAIIRPPGYSAESKWIAAGDVEIHGTAIDENFDHYLVEFGKGNKPEEWTPIHREAKESVEYGILRTWHTSGLEGEYTLRLTVTDKAGLSSIVKQPLTLDNQKAGARIIAPEENQFVTGKVLITGTANDPNFKQYQIKIGQGEEPTTWEQLMESSTSRRAEVLYDWDTTALEGKYSIKLIVEDFTNEPGEVIRHVTVDNTPPQAEITHPKDNQIISGNLEIIGTAQDDHFKNYLVERAPGANPPDNAWKDIEGVAIKLIQDGVLRSWDTTTVDDRFYSLRLTVTDNAGHTAIAQRVITVDNQPPQAELKEPPEKGVVTGMVEIIGTASDKNFQEYKVFIARGEKPGANDWRLISSGDESKTDSVLAEWPTEGLEGVYSIKLVVEDKSGQAPVEDVQIVTVDNTNPQAQITRPIMDEQVGGDIQILGTAYDENFTEYIVEYGAGTVPDDSDWKPISKPIQIPVRDNELLFWNTRGKAGEYSIRLRVLDKVGHEVATQVTVLVQATVVRSQGGEIKEKDQGAKIYIPPNSLPNDTIITINSVSEHELKKHPGWEAAYDFEPFGLQFRQQPYKPAAITIRYPSHLPEVGKTLAIYRFQKQEVDGSVTWVFADKLGGTINRSNQTITSATNRLGRFVVRQEPKKDLGAYVKITQLTCQPPVISPNGGRFSTTGYISFHLNQNSKVTVKIYNLEGYLKKTLIDREQLPQGKNLLDWNGRDSNNEVVSSGAYAIVVKAEGAEEIATETVVVLNDR